MNVQAVKWAYCLMLGQHPQALLRFVAWQREGLLHPGGHVDGAGCEPATFCRQHPMSVVEPCVHRAAPADRSALWPRGSQLELPYEAIMSGAGVVAAKVRNRDATATARLLAQSDGEQVRRPWQCSTT